MTQAKAMLDKINGAIATNDWRELKAELDRGAPERTEYTVETFWERFRDQYCKPRMRSWERYALSFKAINAELGSIRLADFRRHHLHAYVERRSQALSRWGGAVTPSTINRDLTALKSMLSYAVDVGVLEAHPLVRFPMFKEQQKEMRVPTVAEFRHLVECVRDIDPVVAVWVAVVGETGLRKNEAKNLEWAWVDTRGDVLTVGGATKSYRVRHVPLSEFAKAQLGLLVRRVGEPRVFWGAVNVRRTFHAGRKKAGMPWLTVHGLRHFRISEWVRRGVDVRTVQKWAGHSTIVTTMRYAHVNEPQAMEAAKAAQAAEAAELAALEEKRA